MTTRDEARAEAFKRYDGDRIIDENTGEEVGFDDWGYAECQRDAFIAGAEWAAERLSVSPSDDEREALGEWEYRARWDGDDSLWFGVSADRVGEWAAEGYEVQRRRKAGPWEVVPDDRA